VASESLTVTDNRTGKSYDIPIENKSIRATAFRDMKLDDGDGGLRTYDPAFVNTASCISRVSHIDGERGILLYRGYPIEQLAERATFLEVAYLLLYGELPTTAQLTGWVHDITHHTMLHRNILGFFNGFHYDAHPMGMLVSTVAALSTFYPDARDVECAASRELQIHRIIAKMPTIAAYCFRHRLGLDYPKPDNDLSYCGNFLNMLHRMTDQKYNPNPVLEKAIDVLFILHADHGQNCSTSAMRSVGSSRTDPFTALAAATAALYGPLHGGANEAVLRMLRQIGTKDAIPAYINRVKAGEVRLMGFGHRVYKNYDPRATIIKQLADEVFEETGRNALLDIAMELEHIALQDEYFVSRKLYPNVDFYSGLIYEAMGFPVDIFTVLFAIPRASGWLAQWIEMITDEEQKISRPRQVYLGAPKRDFVPINERK
jgi:citrate synthase